LKKFLTEIIADYIKKIEYKNLPKSVIKKTKLCILDSIGCILGGSATEEGKIVIKSLLEGEPGSSTILGCKEKTSLTSAVFINSTLSNILDFDDTYTGHPGATVVPVAFNVGELTNASGKEIITAVLLGYEVSLRIGLGLRPTIERKYVHGSGSWQTFGAVVTASKFFRLNTENIASALGIAGANAPVSSVMKTVYGLTGPTMAKNNFGTASEVGLLSALLARNGFTGPRDIFEGETGFWRMIGTNYCGLDKILYDTLDKEYKILSVTFKPYPCCRLIQSSINAVFDAVNEHNVDLHDIEKILIKTISSLCRQPFSTQVPRNEIEGRFSAPYTIACALRNIKPSEWYENKNIISESLLEIAKKIKLEIDPNADKVLQKDPGKVPATAIIYTKMGKEYSRKVEIAKGDPRNPLTEEELIKKFKMIALQALNDEDKVKSLINMIIKLEELKNINEVTKIL